jgi:hypothetical protein
MTIIIIHLHNMLILTCNIFYRIIIMKITKKVQRKFWLLHFLLLFIASCEKVILPPPTVADEVKFKVDIQPIFDNNCTSCHPPTKGLDLTADYSYNELVPKFVTIADSANPDGSKLYVKIIGTSHSPRTSELEKLKIKKWISQGVPNN